MFYFCNNLGSMPRQSDSAENKPGEKAMMRKLAVTVFVLSVAALGCGSDSGKETPDTGVAAEVGGQKDMGQDQATMTPDAETTVDMGTASEANPSVDGAMVDGSVVVDGGVADAPAADGPATHVDGGSVDGGAGDMAPAVDGGAKLDTAASEAGSID
jgi:hypothetical protein